MRSAKCLAAPGKCPGATRNSCRGLLVCVWFALNSASAFGHDLRPIFIDLSQTSESHATLRWTSARPNPNFASC